MKIWDDYKDSELVELPAERGSERGRQTRYHFGETDPLGGKVWHWLPTSQLNFDPHRKELSLPVWLATQEGLV